MCRRQATAVSSALRRPDGGSTCAGAPIAGMSDAARVRPRSTRENLGIRLCSRSSRESDGSGITRRAPSCAAQCLRPLTAGRSSRVRRLRSTWYRAIGRRSCIGLPRRTRANDNHLGTTEGTGLQMPRTLATTWNSSTSCARRRPSAQASPDLAALTMAAVVLFLANGGFTWMSPAISGAIAPCPACEEVGRQESPTTQTGSDNALRLEQGGLTSSRRFSSSVHNSQGPQPRLPVRLRRHGWLYAALRWSRTANSV